MLDTVSVSSGSDSRPVPSRRRMHPKIKAIDTSERAVKLGVSGQHIILLSITLLTTSIWLFSILLGCYRNTGYMPSKADVPLIWFDHLMRNAGPLIPLPIVMIHWYATLPAGMASTAAAGAAPHHADTWDRGMLYLGLSVSRVGVYLLHMLLAPHVVPLRSEQQHAHILSDHILLGACLVAIFNAEVSTLLSDMWHTWRVRVKLDRVLLIAALALTALLFALTCAEMSYTAQYFHGTAESLLAAAAGLFLFQIPAAIFLKRAASC